MKQFIFMILAVCIILLCGCQSEVTTDESLKTDPPFLDATWQEVTEPSQSELITGATTPATEERSDIIIIDTQPVSLETTPLPTEDMVKDDDKEPSPTEIDPPEVTVPATEVTEPPAEEEPQATEATQPSTEPAEEVEPTVATEPDESQIQKATAADAQAIAAKLVEYLNAYRMEQGAPAATVLPGLTQYAAYRSRQLVSNFAHDTADERAAATALEYGTYVDPALYGMTGDPYYTANAREAIAKTDYGGSVEEVAAYLARMTRNSASHWSYVGGAGYVYIGVGITWENGTWYCDIAVTGTNTDQ